MWAKMIYMISMEFVYVLNYYLKMCPPLLSPLVKMAHIWFGG